MSTTYDICWTDPAHREQAISILTPVPDTERQRRHNPFCIRRWENCPIPAQDGSRTTLTGDCIAVDMYGSSILRPGAYRGNKLANEHIVLTEIEPGLIAGTVLPEFWDLPEVIQNADQQKASEQKSIDEIEQGDVEQSQKLITSLRRLYGLAARSMGIDPAGMTDQELQDCYLAASLSEAEAEAEGTATNRPLPSVESWLALTGQKTKSQFDDLGYWDWSSAVRGSMVERQEKVLR